MTEGKLINHQDGMWWTSETEYKDHRLMIKMNTKPNTSRPGAKIHVFNSSGQVIKTFAYNFAKPQFLINKARLWLDKPLTPQPMTPEQIKEQFIVAEITKNWTNETPVSELLSQKFEAVININASRGYRLIDWRFNAVVNKDTLTETIIAIFSNKPI